MLKALRIFDQPKHAVLSLSVQASIYTDERPQRNPFQVLLRHFLDRFFNNPTTAADGETKAHVLQIAYAIGLPGVCVALYLFPPYHFPGGRHFWSQVGDHYFYVMYSFVAIGAVTIFVWDLFFPDLLDVFVLSTLSIERRTLFLARIAAVFVFLGIFLLGANVPGTIFFPAAADLPSLARHISAHLIAVTMSGLFISSSLIALQGLLLTALGERVFRNVSPFIQGLAMAALVTVLLLFPLISQFLQALIGEGRTGLGWHGAAYFPPFWFLGVYERLLTGPATLSVFTVLARIGCLSTAATVALAAIAYPLAYRSRMRQVVEGFGRLTGKHLISAPVMRLLHATLLRIPERRGVFHFIGQTMLRTPRHRVYLAMYGGLGLALVIACASMLKLGDGGVRYALSTEGLRAAVPIIAFWTVAGLRSAFLGPADRRLNWIFRVIHGRAGWDELAAARIWVLLSALILTLGGVVAIHAIAPPELRPWREFGIHLGAGASLCLLLTDAFFLNVKTVPFTGTRSPASMNLAYTLIQYFGLFPPLVLLTLSLEDWAVENTGHLLITLTVVCAAHVELLRHHRRILREYTNLLDIDEDEEEFPQRLGLRY
jgi:hypothetical protein